ncbi:MAG TPA: ATP-binding protein [Solirubrobacteraceae bacterium]|nr:ATP-binding protein [Solirubrobacteraceae bacterium]
MRDIRELFPTDDPVRPDLLIGRSSDVQDLAKRLGAGTHMVLAGPRRTGKSTVALAALARAGSAGLYTAQVDLWDHEDMASLTRALAQSILANRGSVAKALERARESGRELRELLPRGVVATLRTHLGEDVELAWNTPSSSGRSELAGLGATIALAQRIAEKDDRRIVLFLDEFQDIATSSHRFGDPDLLGKQLRSQLQRSPLVSVLFAGSMEHLMRDLFGPARRALGQFGNFHELSPILPSEWEAGIAARYHELDVRPTEEAVAEIVTLGEGHPRTTMLIARETLTVTLSHREIGTIEIGDVRGGYELAMQADRLRHEDAVERLRSTAHAYPIAVRVARGRHPYSGTASSAARRALSMMERVGIAEHHGRGDWTIPEPLLRKYLAERP